MLPRSFTSLTNSFSLIRFSIWYIVCSAVVLSLGKSLHARQQSITSLYQEFDACTDDSCRVRLLNTIALRHLDLNQFKKGIDFSYRALSLSRSTNNKEGEGSALRNIGTYYEYLNRFDSSVVYFQKSYLVYKTEKDSLEMMHTLMNLGQVYLSNGTYDSALYYFERTRSYFMENMDTATLARTINMIGMVHSTRGEEERALELFLESLELCKTIDDKIQESISYCNLGMTYRKLGNPEKAESFLNKAINLNKKFGPTRDMLTIQSQYGILLREKKMFRESIRMFEKNINLAKYYNDQRMVAKNLNDVGEIYYLMNSFSDAVPYFERSLDKLQTLDILDGKVRAYNNLALAYLEISNQQSKRNTSDTKKKILSYLDQSLKLARQSMDFNDMEFTLRTLIRVYSTFENYQLAVEFQQELVTLMDSTSGSDKLQEIARLKASFEREQQEQIIKLLQTENLIQESVMKRKNTELYLYLGGGFTLLLLIAGLINRLQFINRSRKALAEKNQLIEEEKNRAKESENIKEQFLAKMSHEIRIPMNTIIGSVNIMKKQQPLKSQLKYLNAIHQSSENLLVIIDDILDLNKIKEGGIEFDKTSFSLREEINNVIEILEFKAKEKGIELYVDINSDIPDNIIGDSIRLNQILINLIGNGIKFTEKGHVKLTIKHTKVSEKKINLRFAISDTGIGIPADRIDKIFSSFTQANKDTNLKYGGTGLGLTISKQLVELQNGEISVQSTLGEGSVFSFVIPYVVSTNKGIEKEEGSQLENDKLNDLDVLIVEDDEFNLMVLKDTLESSFKGIKINDAQDGKSAIELAAKNKYDLIFMDVEIPEIDGCRVTKLVRETRNLNSSVPIIAMTANAMQKEVEECFEAGMNDFIAKPFDPENLIIKVNALLHNNKKK